MSRPLGFVRLRAPILRAAWRVRRIDIDDAALPSPAARYAELTS